MSTAHLIALLFAAFCLGFVGAFIVVWRRMRRVGRFIADQCAVIDAREWNIAEAVRTGIPCQPFAGCRRCKACGDGPCLGVSRRVAP